MRIRSLLHIFLAAALLLVLLLSLANWQLMQRLDAVSTRLDQAQASVRNISTLLILTHEYALHSEERAAQQWKESLAALTGQLNGNDSAATGPLAPHLDELRRQTAVMSEIFEKLEAASQSPETPLQVRRKHLLLDQMLTKVGVLSDSIEHLQQATRVKYEKAYRQHHRLGVATTWAVLVILVVLSVLLRRRVLQPLARLQTSVRAVAKGDLTVRSASTANDELGELSRTFDAMAVDLVAELRKEVAERKQLEIERQKFFLLAESSSEFIGMCDLGMNPHYVNPAGQRLVGLPDMAAACRVKVQDYFFPEDQRFIAEEFFPRVLRKGHGEVEIRLRNFQTGEPIWMLYSLFSVHDASGTPVGWATVSRDITERRTADEARRQSRKAALNLMTDAVEARDRAEQASQELLKSQEELAVLNAELELKVEQRTAQLEATNKELEAFSYSVSHDLRAPLRHISGYVNLLNTRFREALPEKAGHYLNEITDSAEQMGTLIDDLLQFSRTGRQEMRQADLEMNAVVQEVIEKLKPDTENRNISWTVADLPRVYGDYALLKQVWINLLDNAVKYTREKEVAIIEVGFTREADHWEFFVRDNGVGFDMQYAHKLFGVFQRLHSPAQFEGTGIGLANVQRIVLKHGGRVRAEAQPEKGATFYFTLPEKS